MTGSTLFKKKVYQKLESSPLSESILPPPSSKGKKLSQKIVRSTGGQGLREEIKKSLLPLLIDLFELRQLIENCHYQMEVGEEMPFFEKLPQSPQMILKKLEGLQREIEEAQRWCEGVGLQIAKGIKEAKEAVQKANGKKAGNIFKRLLGRMIK